MSTIKKRRPGPSEKPKSQHKKQKSFGITAQNWVFFKSMSWSEQTEFSRKISDYINEVLNNKRVKKTLHH